MSFKLGISGLLLVGLLWTSVTSAEESGVRQDARAIEVLKSASAYTASLDRVVLKSVSLTDARLGGGLMVSNSTEVKVSVERPGSAHISSFDGINTKELFFRGGKFTVYNSENSYYAQTEIPNNLDAAMEFILEDLDVEAPLMDLIFHDTTKRLIGSQETIIYLADKARIAGVDCHHLAVRGPESDVQLWVEEGDRPMLRKIIITSKWEGGSPRFVANLKWDTSPDFKDDVFDFKAPEGSINIGFQGRTKGGE
jgi:hypothetical protein